MVDPRSKEKIPCWMYKSARDDIVRLLIRIQVREKGHNFDWNHLNILTCINHGKGFVHATLICVLCKLDASSNHASHEEEQHCFSVGHAQCAKDNADIEKGTFGSLLNDEMKSITHAKKLRIWLPSDDISSQFSSTAILQAY